MNPTQAVRNTFVVFGGQIVARLLDLCAMLLIARSFGESAFGRFSFALAYVGYFAIVVDLGFNTIFVRELVRTPERTADLLTGMLTVKLALIAIGMGLAGGLILLPGYPLDTVRIVWIMTLALLISPKFPSLRLVYEQAFQARLRMGIPMLLKLIDGALLVGLVYGLVRYGQPLQAVVMAYVASNLPGLVIIVWASRRLVIPSNRFDRQLMARLLGQALPVALLGVFATLYSRIDVFFLSLWRGDVEVGYYAAAYRLTESLRMIPGAVLASLYPVMAHAYERASETLPAVLASGLKPLLIVIIPICLGTTVFSDRLIGLLYTSRFAPAGVALAVLVWAELFVVINFPLSYALISADRQWVVIGITLTMLLTNLAINTVLIPRWGYMGASAATVITEGIGMAGYGVAARRWLGLSLWRIGLPLLPSAGVVLAWMFVARTFPMPVIIAGSLLLYILSLGLTKGITGGEWATLKTAVIGGQWSLKERQE